VHRRQIVFRPNERKVPAAVSAMFAGERLGNREPLERRLLRRINRPADHNHIGETHGQHQRSGIDIRIDALAQIVLVSAQPGNDRARDGDRCGIERHQLPPCELQHSISSPRVSIPSPISLLVTGNWKRRPWL